MNAAVILIILISVAAAVYMIRPLLARDATEAEERQRDSVDSLRELHARQQMLLASLKDLDDDRATDKLDDGDYESLKAKLSAQAIEVMRQIDELEAEHRKEIEAEEAANRPLQYPAPDTGDGSR
jgi:hypothetical protein